jgi:enoyl-CoA hydratase
MPVNLQFANLVFEVRNEHIGLLTINRPQVLNALNTATFGELNQLFDALAADRKIRGLIITGSGKSFVAGADLSEIQDDKSEENRAYASLGQNTLNRLENLPFPTIAAVNGFALGGGCEVALACDLRIASENAKFGLPEVSLGVIPCFGGTQRLPRLIGAGLAKEIIFTGRQVRAQEAGEIGLVNKVVESGQLLETALGMMAEIVNRSPLAVKYAKVAVDRGLYMALNEGLELEKDLSALCYGLPDKEEGIKAFLQKRKPVWG